MIKVENIEAITRRLYYLIEYGVRNNYSLGSIEEFVALSDMFKQLENGEENFLNIRNSAEEIEETYRVDSIDFLSEEKTDLYWVSQTYIYLFFKYRKPISYIFLYLPIEDLLKMYRIFHELDISYVYENFDKRVEATSLLKMLINKRDLSINKLSQLTGISESTLIFYSKKDSSLYNASNHNIYRLSIALRVNSNIFYEHIMNYTESSNYNINKSNPKYRNYLGLYYVSYFFKEIAEKNFKYDKDEDVFKSEDSLLKVLWTDNFLTVDNDVVELEKKYSNYMKDKDIINLYLVIFEFNSMGLGDIDLTPLQNSGFKKIFVICEDKIFKVNSTITKKEIPYFVHKNLINRAKEEVGNDFAMFN